MNKIKKNKICHLTSVHPVFDIRIFYKECYSLAKAGYNVTLIAANTTLKTKENVQIVPVHLPQSRLLRMFLVTFIMFSKAIKQKAKLYHFHDPELMFCGILLKCFGKKVIFDIHENVRLSIKTKAWLPNWTKPILSMLYYLIERFSILFYDQLILAEASYQNYYPQNKSTIVLNYPINNIKVNLDKERTSSIRLVYSGVVHELRGVWEMVGIVKRLKEKKCNVSLDLIGELRPYTLRSELDAYLNIHDLKDQVHIHGRIDFSEVSSYLSKATVGLSLLKPIPNYLESLPTKIFEYMQHKLPVITNDFPLYKEYVEQFNTGICININSIDESFDKIEKLLYDSAKFYEMGQCGKNMVNEFWNWETQELKLVGLYATLL